MAQMPRADREALAARRIVKILGAQKVAGLRTLEHKIADAGPNPMRVQPHIITPAKVGLLKSGRVVAIKSANAQWLHLAEENPEIVEKRLVELQVPWAAFSKGAVTRRTGQALEVAVFRALDAAPTTIPLGGFTDLDQHPDDQLYSKQELRAFNGKSLGNEALDFIVSVSGDFCGIEVKNTRPWLYPHDPEIKAMLRKCLTLNVIPVLIGRRLPFVTLKVLGPCGVLLHETYNQRMANADADLAVQVRHKNLLGYHDVRVSNVPDGRLTKFIETNLPIIVPAAREKFVRFSDLLAEFAYSRMDYAEFAARTRRRLAGQKEDNDWPDREEHDLFD